MLLNRKRSPGHSGAGPTSLVAGSLLARNSFWNLLGQIAPMFVGLVAIPRLIHALGTDRFGVLTIAWMVVGYFSLFDLGIGRAMTNLVAQRLGSGNTASLPRIVWTANVLMGFLGLLGTLLFASLAPTIVRHVLKMPALLQIEAIQALRILSISIPFVISAAGLRGILEARQRFIDINLVRIPTGIATFAAPLIILPWSNRLPGIIGILLAARVLFWMAYILAVYRDMPFLLRTREVDWRLLPMLLNFGAWMTVSNVVSPMMTYLDRFLVGAILSLSAVAYYATPFEVVTKLLLIPAAIVGVLFPAFSTAIAADVGTARKLFVQAVKYVSLALFPLSVSAIALAHVGLNTWLGPEFASHSTRALQWLAIGVFANGLAALPFALIQGEGRADITGKLHLLELPFYCAAVWTLTKGMGIEGTALAWMLRVSADCILLFWIAHKRLLIGTVKTKSYLVWILTIGTAFALAMVRADLRTKSLCLAFESTAYLVISWMILFKRPGKHSFSRPNGNPAQPEKEIPKLLCSADAVTLLVSEE